VLGAAGEDFGQQDTIEDFSPGRAIEAGFLGRGRGPLWARDSTRVFSSALSMSAVDQVLVRVVHLMMPSRLPRDSSGGITGGDRTIFSLVFVKFPLDGMLESSEASDIVNSRLANLSPSGFDQGGVGPCRVPA
jgi:hypothetical protein